MKTGVLAPVFFYKQAANICVLFASLGSAIASSVVPCAGTFAELASLRHPHNVSRHAFAPSVQLAGSSRDAHITHIFAAAFMLE